MLRNVIFRAQLLKNIYRLPTYIVSIKNSQICSFINNLIPGITITLMTTANKSKKTSFGLFSRMLVAIFMMLVAMLTVVSYSIVQIASNQFNDFRVSNAKSLAKSFTSSINTKEKFDNKTALTQAIRSAIPSHHGAYVYISDLHGKVVAGTDKSLTSLNIIPHNITSDNFTHHLVYNDRPVIEVVSKLITSNIHQANMHIAFYNDAGNFQLFNNANDLILPLLLILLVTFTGTYIIINKLRTPVLSLIKTIVNTDFSSPFNLPLNISNRKDEVGVLARNFDDVFNRLYNANQKAQQTREQLEDRVKQRTQQLAEINDELNEEKIHINTIIDNAGDSIITLNNEGIIETYNNAAEKLFGYSLSEIKGKNITALMPDSYKQAHINAFNRYVAMESPDSLSSEAREVIGKRKDGSEFHLEIKINTIRLHDKHLFVGLLRDITLQKQTKESLERSNELLEEKVRERTEELKNINKEMLITRDAALEASKIKSEFLSTISHELRTPLHAITGYENILSMTELTEKQAKYCKQINIGAQNLLEIINEILDFSAFESGKFKIKNAMFSVSEILYDICNMFKHSAEKKDIELSCNLDDDVPKSIYSDITRLRQTIVNLVSNAIKFTENGSVEIRVSVSKQTNYSSPGKLLISVKDTGIGIERNQYQKIFSPFYQVDGSVNRSYGGTGIGLAMSKNIIELMGGHISIDSHAGRGSTFTIDLPLVTSEPYSSNELTKDSDFSSHENLHPEDNIDINGAGNKILIVEDNEANAELLSIFLEEVGYKADIAENGSIFLDMIAKNNYELVFMDCQMPILNGYDATMEYRKREKDDKHIPIIAVTANAMTGDREKCLACGMDDYIEKPVKPIRIKEALLNWLEQPQKIA